MFYSIIIEKVRKIQKDDCQWLKWVWIWKPLWVLNILAKIWSNKSFIYDRILHRIGIIMFSPGAHLRFISFRWILAKWDNTSFDKAGEDSYSIIIIITKSISINDGDCTCAAVLILLNLFDECFQAGTWTAIKHFQRHNQIEMWIFGSIITYGLLSFFSKSFEILFHQKFNVFCWINSRQHVQNWKNKNKNNNSIVRLLWITAPKGWSLLVSVSPIKII